MSIPNPSQAIVGMSRDNGKVINKDDHIKQSIVDILTTPIGSRLQRREYGSHLFALIDSAGNAAGCLRLQAAAVDALERWEPRIQLDWSRVTLQMDGVVTLEYGYQQKRDSIDIELKKENKEDEQFKIPDATLSTANAYVYPFDTIVFNIQLEHAVPVDVTMQMFFDVMSYSPIETIFQSIEVKTAKTGNFYQASDIDHGILIIIPAGEVTAEVLLFTEMFIEGEVNVTATLSDAHHANITQPSASVQIMGQWG
ncbi:MAG: hypothetical protein CR974_04070 [Gammaproteobacteria bacterium]|nr:MAG: hypothetical protein CR974_04070 [Gammaproteobacteria bacterium]